MLAKRLSIDERKTTYLELVGDQEQQKAALKKIHSEEEGHMLKPWIILKNGLDGFCSADSVACRIDESLRGDPMIAIVEEGDGIPFAGKKYMQNVHNMRSVSDDDLCLHIRFGDVNGRSSVVRVGGVDRVNRVHRWSSWRLDRLFH